MHCHAMSCNVMQCHAMPCNAMQCHAMPCNIMPCYDMHCHAMPCIAMRNAMQCLNRDISSLMCATSIVKFWPLSEASSALSHNTTSYQQLLCHHSILWRCACFSTVPTVTTGMLLCQHESTTSAHLYLPSHFNPSPMFILTLPIITHPVINNKITPSSLKPLPTATIPQQYSLLLCMLSHYAAMLLQRFH